MTSAAASSGSGAGTEAKSRRKSAPFYRSEQVMAFSGPKGTVHVDVRPRLPAGVVASVKEIFGKDGEKLALSEFQKVAASALMASFSGELEKVVASYRTHLRESLATGDDPVLKEALNRARLQEKILAGASMVDQAQACELLGLSAKNPSATMKRKEEKREVLRFTVEGRATYPLFQFDVEGRSIYPVMSTLIARKPEHWSDFRLLHWLLRPHLDFGSAPAEHLRDAPQEVVEAFEREIEPVMHG